MFLFKIKADATDIDVPLIRSLLSCAAILTFISRNQHNYIACITVAILLLITAVFAEVLLVKFRIDSLIVIIISCLLALVVSYDLANLVFMFFLILMAVTMRLAYIQPTVEFAEKGIRIKKSFSTKTYEWPSFSNIILKDNLLTLDFKNNKLLQLELDTTMQVNEKEFNDFCAQKITQ